MSPDKWWWVPYGSSVKSQVMSDKSCVFVVVSSIIQNKFQWSLKCASSNQSHLRSASSHPNHFKYSVFEGQMKSQDFISKSHLNVFLSKLPNSYFNTPEANTDSKPACHYLVVVVFLQYTSGCLQHNVKVIKLFGLLWMSQTHGVTQMIWKRQPLVIPRPDNPECVCVCV